MGQRISLYCACGQFHMTIRGAPIVSTECHCSSCRSAARRLAELPVSQAMQTAGDSTRYVLYRKDRVDFPDGTALLREFRLSPEAATRRVLTACCRTPVFLEFKGGHWLSVYANLWRDTPAPAVQLRTMTANAPSPVPGDLPSGSIATAGFYAKLLGAWVAMGFKAPAIKTNGVINA